MRKLFVMCHRHGRHTQLLQISTEIHTNKYIQIFFLS